MTYDESAGEKGVWHGADVYAVQRGGSAFLQEKRVCGLRFSAAAGGAAGDYSAERAGE